MAIVIEYALLFALGFLTASLLAVVIAPAIHRRIVAYTERRIFATMPISREEVHAQKAMVRATMAAENARIGSDLSRERQKVIDATLKTEAMQNEAIRLTGQLKDLQAALEEMQTEASAMRSDIRRVDLQNSDLKGALNHSQVSIDALRRENELHLERMRRLELDLSTSKVELASRDADNETLSLRIQAVRHERDALRADFRQSGTTISDLQQRTEQSEARLVRLEQKTFRQASDIADLETKLERRNRELERVRERLKTTVREKDALRVALKAAGLALPVHDDQAPEPEEPALEADMEADAPHTPGNPGDEELSAHAAALSARVMAASDDHDDNALRDELASLAAAMTAQASSDAKVARHIRDIVGLPTASNDDDNTLARRIRLAMGEKAGAVLNN